MESLWERNYRAEDESPRHYWQVYVTEGDFSP